MYPSSGTTERSQQEVRFATHLSELKERGSALLVVGELPRDCYSAHCHGMLGDPTAGTRCRLLIDTDANRGTSSRGEDGPSASSGRVATRRILSTFDSRSTAAASATARESELVRHVEESNLSNLGIAISEEIDEFETRRGELEPAELRVCFDSLRPLVEEYGEGSVFRFLHVLAGRIRSASGMGHFHLPVPFDDELTKTFADIFDAVIELRRRDDELVQRWHLRNPDITSDWLSV